MLEYTLEDNELTDKPGDLRAQVINVTSYTQNDIVVNNPSEVIAVIPPLSAGTYRVRIITQYTSGKPLKTPHTFTFDKDLTVA
jgi:hypothetical protein